MGCDVSRHYISAVIASASKIFHACSKSAKTLDEDVCQGSIYKSEKLYVKVNKAYWKCVSPASHSTIQNTRTLEAKVELVGKI